MMSAWKGGGGGGGHAEDEVTHTRFSSHSSRNCWNFWDIRSWALPTALRIFPRTAGEGEKKNTQEYMRACARARCNYSHAAAYCSRVAALTGTLRL